MEDWVQRALARWPNVPALFGWLGLDRRGRWLIRGEPISRPQIIDTINRNYAPDPYGRWYFQNGPQRGYVSLAYTPLVLHTGDGGRLLLTHTGLRVSRVEGAYLDEEGAIVLLTEHGPGVIADNDLEWALAHITTDGRSLDEEALAAALALPSGQRSALNLHYANHVLPLQRLDSANLPKAMGFEREPRPRAGEPSPGPGPLAEGHTRH